MILFFSHLSAETLESLQREITSTDTQITRLQKEYERLKKTTENLLHRQELGKAYAGAERLSQINLQLNQIRAGRIQLCEQWRTLYRKSMEDLLAAAEREKDRKKRGEIGKRLQEYQSWNAQLCAEGIPVPGAQEWQSLRIESYDGPQEIQQKTQLLRDIEREMRITLTKLENRHQDFLREQKTKERAQEFVQEGTLFDEGVAVRTGTTSLPPLAEGPTPEVVSTESTKQSPNATAAAVTTWQSEQDSEQFETQYNKNRAQLLQQQKQLLEKIREFEQGAKALRIP